ncbi:hypothetical protein J31TS4_36980 [Paenibacillus sp. J31TS4]|nr:hypothetical protein J31TS4_36980 [Paenibacillus sp. J31TS4]
MSLEPVSRMEVGLRKRSWFSRQEPASRVGCAFHGKGPVSRAREVSVSVYPASDRPLRNWL